MPNNRLVTWRRYMQRFLYALLAVIATVLFSSSSDILISAAPTKATRKDFTILAQQYSYTPNRINVNLGDEVHIKLGALDAVHGFYLEGYDFEAEILPGKIPFKVKRPSKDAEFSKAEEIVFIADRPGKFRYRCSITCGTLHPFMLGEFIVHPNKPFHFAIVGLTAILLTAFIFMFNASRNSIAGMNSVLPSWRIDLLKSIPKLKRLIKSPWFQFVFLLINLAAFILFIFAGFFGSPIGNRNIIITIVWILWWFVLISFLIPFGSRIWCMMCPFPLFGEWYQRRKLLTPDKSLLSGEKHKLRGFSLKWPGSLSNIWIQNILFLTLCTFSTILVTRPVVTAAVLSSLVILAFFIHLFFRKRTFCRYLCPLGGWMNVYSTASMVEVRPRDASLCAKCSTKSCAMGNSEGWGCSWDLFPGRLSTNNYCGMCLECIKTCKNNNMTLLARPFCSDNHVRSYDQAWMIFIMMTLSIFYTAIFLGPWGTIKGWANISEMGDWKGFFLYLSIMWVSCLFIMPLLWYLASRASKFLAGQGSGPKVHDIFLEYSYILVPLGLLSWIAFSFPLVFVNYTHITTSLSDPLGWGWNLFGTADNHWEPLLSEYLHWIQVPLIIMGLWFSLNQGFIIAKRHFTDGVKALLSLIPFGLVNSGLALLLIILFAG